MLVNEWTKVPFTVAHEVLVKMHVASIHTGLPPFRNMTDKDKSGLVKCGVEQLGLIQMVRGACVQFPIVLPGFHTTADYYAKCDSVDVLISAKGEVEALLAEINTALMGAEDDAIRISLDYYYSMKRADKSSSLPGLRPRLKQIRNTFKKSAGKSIEDLHPETVPGDDNDDTPGDQPA